MRVWYAAAVLAVVAAGLIGSSLTALGLEGPQLYVYSDLGVYQPGSTAVFRVLAVGVDGSPASGVNVQASIHDPNFMLVRELDGVTDGGGWFVFSVVLETEGFYTISVYDVGGEYISAETTVFVCSRCPYEVPTLTVTSFATTTVYEETTVYYGELTTTVTRTELRTELRNTTYTSIIYRTDRVTVLIKLSYDQLYRDVEGDYRLNGDGLRSRDRHGWC